MRKTVWMRLVLSTMLVITYVLGGYDSRGEAASPAPTLKEVQAVIQKMQARYQKTSDLEAVFVQKTIIEGFDTPLLSHGQVYIKKPGRLRWDYHDPNVEEIYVNKNQVQIYVPEHKQVLVGDLTKLTASQAPLELLQGVANLEKEFTIEPTKGKSRGEGGLPLVTLIPSSQAPDSRRQMKKVVIELAPQTHYLKTVSIYEPSGNISRFEFSNLKANTSLDESLFTLKIPNDVEVVDASEMGGM